MPYLCGYTDWCLDKYISSNLWHTEIKKMCISLKLRLDFSCKAGLKLPILLEKKVFSQMTGQQMPLGWWFHLPCILPSWVSCALFLLLLLLGSHRQLAHVAESLELARTTGFEGDAGRERLRWSNAFWSGYVEPPRVLFGDKPQPCPKPLGLLMPFLSQEGRARCAPSLQLG